MHAELAYLFRHALMRDAAYDLQLPHERSRLHALAHDAIAGLFAARESELDAMALELARHAAEAAADESQYAVRECEWLDRAARFAALGWRGAEAAALYQRVADHACSDSARRTAALCGAGKCLLDIGRLQPAVESLEKAVATAGEPAHELAALRPLSYAYRNVGRHEEALAVARRIAELTRESANLHEHALALDSIATALTGLERNFEALPIAEQAVAKAIESGMPRVIGGLKANMGTLLGRVRERKRGIAMLREALMHLAETGDRRALAAARRNLADQLRAEGEPEAASAECNIALSEMRELGDRRGEGMALLTLGGIAKDTDRPLDALPLLLQSAGLLLESGDRRAAALAFGNAAGACLDSGRLGDCEKLLQDTEQLADQSRASRASAMALAIRADLRREQGRFADSAECYLRASEAYGRLQDRTHVGWMLCERAIVLRRGGDPQAAGASEHALANLRAVAPEDIAYFEAKWREAST